MFKLSQVTRPLTQEEIKRIVAVEREQMRLREEQARQAQVLEKHEAWLVRHDEEIEKLQYRLDKAEDEIMHFSDMLELLTAQRNEMVDELGRINRALLLVREGMDPNEIAHNRSLKQFDGATGAMEYMDRFAEAHSGMDKKKAAAELEKMRKRKATLETKIITHNNKIFSAQQKIKKAQRDRAEAQRKMEVA